MNSQAKPFIPKRGPPTKSVYTNEDYDINGNLIRHKEVPLGDQYDKKRGNMMIDNGGSDSRLGGSVNSKQVGSSSASAPASAPAAAITTRVPGNPDIAPPPMVNNKLSDGRYDVETPDNLRAPRDSQHVAVIRTIENHHPDEDRILNHFFLQYVARREGRYNPVEDPPVILSTILPTACVIIDRVFSKDEVDGSEGLKRIEKYVKASAACTNLDVVPVRMYKPFHVPLPLSTNFKYKHAVIDQIMSEFHQSQEESSLEIMRRVEADRKGEDAKKPKWHLYDGISEKGHFGPNTIIKSEGEGEKKKDWAQITEEEEKDEDDIDDEEEWKTVGGKGKAKAKAKTRK